MSRLMRNVLLKLCLIVALVFVARLAHATDVAYSGTFVGTEGLATTAGSSAGSATYTRDMNTTGDRVSMQVVYSTYTVAVSTTFNSGNYTLSTPTITLSGINPKWVTGQQVLYSTGAVALSGLTNQTTYYVSVLSQTPTAMVFKLASTLANATAGTGIVLASSSSVANNYTLAPLAWTNTSGGGLQFQWSDDNVNFVNATTGNYNATISSVTFVSGGGNTLYDLGFIQHRYLRVKEVGATTGATAYTVTDNERYSFKH